jgi:oligosaccharide repeat unit polymerase
MTATEGDDLKPPTPKFPVLRLWWLSPVGVTLFVAVAAITPTALIGDQTFRIMWRSPKSVTGETLLLFGCGAAALAFGALIAIAASPVKTRLSAPWPSLSERSARLLRRSSSLLTVATLVGYAAFVYLIARAGLTPSELFSDSKSGSGTDTKQIIGTIPGLTTLTQFGIVAVVVSTILLVRKYSRFELFKLLIVVGLAIPRAYIFDERLAILELAVPIVVILAAGLSFQQGFRRVFAQLMPAIFLLAVVVIFGVFEYFRSWNFYRTRTTTSYPEFALSRLAGYYTTALNNGQLVLNHLRWPNRLPYDTLEAFWSAPGVRQFGLYERLGGHEPPYPEPRMEPHSPYGNVLAQFGNPEFNNNSGYVGGFIDYGTLGGVLFFFIAGVAVGLLYRAFRNAKPLGLFFYPVIFLGLVEMPRYIYWAAGRATYAWIALLAITALVARSEAAANHEQ